jgi:hypothetical protein
MPTDSNALAFPPFLHSRAEFVDHAGDFMPWDARVRNSWQKPFLGDHIAVTDPTGLHANPYLSRAGFRNFALHDFEFCSCLWHLHYFHFRHSLPPFDSDRFVTYSFALHRYQSPGKAYWSISLISLPCS